MKNKFMSDDKFALIASAVMVIILGIGLWGQASASSITFTFNSPSFSGIGQGSHYLTIENLEKSRKDAIIAKAEAEERQTRKRTKEHSHRDIQKELRDIVLQYIGNTDYR